MLENVPGLINHDNGRTFKLIIDTLEKELDYYLVHRVLDSVYYGLPQHRKRIYLVGFHNKFFRKAHHSFFWPKEKLSKVGIGQFVEHHETGYEIKKRFQENYIFKKDDGKPQVIDRTSNIQVNTLVATYHKIQRLTGTFVRDGKTGLRLLSENECKAIMGFPKDFKIPVSRTQMYRQFGNSVAIPVVQAIAGEMIETLNNSLKEQQLKKVSTISAFAS